MACERSVSPACLSRVPSRIEIKFYRTRNWLLYGNECIRLRMYVISSGHAIPTVPGAKSASLFHFGVNGLQIIFVTLSWDEMFDIL
jgi:hypothetical protein